MIFRFIFLILVTLLFSCNSVTPPEPVLPVPSERQLAWHELEFYAFVHFNMNTFSDMEWGMGNEKPEQFNPSELDCRQWARVCKEAGMKGIILTAKHHDGFCLWPSQYTEHSVKNSPWKNGEGDVLQELREACDEYGLKMGVYLSPWDRNHADYGKPEYITYFRNQLRELLTNYGDIFEVWFDGANGGDGYYGGANEVRKVDKQSYYDWENTYPIIRKLQPHAVIFSDAGPDVRWVGNEHGFAYPTTWNPLLRDEVYGGMPEYAKKYSMGQENGTHWVAPEADVSIRPGWYYHKYEDHKVKSLPHLLDIYYRSIGQNASLLINFPVDTRGLIHEKDVEQIMKLANAVKADFANNLALGKPANATNVRGGKTKYSAENVTDGDPETSWVTDDGLVNASLTIDLGEATDFNRVLIQEDIRLGQRVKQFQVEAYNNNKWKQIASETTIGRKRILRLPTCQASKIRVKIIDAKACPVISNIEIYKAPKLIIEPDITRDKNGLVSITTFSEGLTIYYTLDGTKPNTESSVYTEPFELKSKAQLRAIVHDSESNKSSEVAIVDFDIAREKWNLAGEYKDIERAELMFDGDFKTAWTLKDEAPVDFIIDLGEVVDVAGFNYLPDQQRWNPGVIKNYEFYISRNRRVWGKPVSEGEFSNIKNSPIWQKKEFPAKKGRYIKLRALAPAQEKGRVGIAEFTIISK